MEITFEWSWMWDKVLREMDQSDDLEWSWNEKFYVGRPSGAQPNDTSLVRRGGIQLTDKGMKPVYEYRTREEWRLLDSYRQRVYRKSCCSPGRVCAACCV